MCVCLYIDIVCLKGLSHLMNRISGLMFVKAWWVLLTKIQMYSRGDKFYTVCAGVSAVRRCYTSTGVETPN
jgi:hypothetical protein